MTEAMNARSIPAAAALAAFTVHAFGNPHYGFFRDELYFIVCGFHPAWGYVDQPPVVPLLAAGSQLFGHSLFALRLIPACFAAGGVYITCVLASELGGGAFAQLVAAAGFLFSGVLTSFGMKAGPDMVGLWLWPLAALYAVRVVNGGSPRQWLAAGAALGVSIESKYSALFFIAALAMGLIATPQRRFLASPWFMAGAALAGAIALPNLIWQAAYGFPMWQVLHHGVEFRNVNVGPLTYVFQQLLITNIVVSPIWLAGLAWLFLRPSYRFLAVAYVAMVALMIAFHGKHYYMGDVYPPILAAGGVAVEGWTQRLRFVRYGLAAALVPASAFLPFSLPILSESSMLAYVHWVKSFWHVRTSMVATIRDVSSALPSDWADMHGWPELTATVAQVYDALPPGRRAEAVIYTRNYGEASAIDFFGKAYGLPPAISGNNNFWLWGTHGYSGQVVIDVNGHCIASDRLFENARLATHFDDRWTTSFERNIPISVCTGIREPLAAAWPRLRLYM